MRYLGQLGVAAQVASRAESDTRATTGRPAEDLPGEPGLREEQAAAWRAWAAGDAARPPRRILLARLSPAVRRAPSDPVLVLTRQPDPTARV